jgi:protein SCO1/2
MALLTAAICVAAALAGVLLASGGGDGAAARVQAGAWAGAVRPAGSGLGRDLPVYGISVDPANDTPRSAQAFLLEQKMKGRMEFLLGSRAALEPLWSAFGIAPQTRGREHSAYVVLLDAHGRQRVGFPFARLTPDGLAHDLARLSPAA